MNPPSTFDVREDEEQQQKLQEIIELLTAAGYFRARIKGLSPFDKVVGGLTWCIEMCNIDIDIDLFYQDTLKIGQKIALTEKIVAALPKMKCPFHLEPHQIQGLDAISIFPVVQWLVKRGIETRQEMGDYIRSFSLMQFSRACEANISMHVEGDKVIQHLKESHRPQRCYRHCASGVTKDEVTRTQTTLLEYGRKFVAVIPDIKKDNEKTNAKGDSALEESQEKIKMLMTNMALMDKVENKLAASVVGSIVNRQSDVIQQVASEYAEKQAELEGEFKSGIGGLQHHNRVTASLQKRIAAKETQLQELESNRDTLAVTIKEKQEILKNLQTEHKNICHEVQQMQKIENSDSSSSIFQKLHALVSLNESLKTQEANFRAHCKEELQRLQNSIKEIESGAENIEVHNQDQIVLINTHYETDKAKLQKARLVLAAKNREIAILQRKIDEVPSRAELSQYQKRFVELYSQISAKHKETKQFYTLYNTLEDSRAYLTKEVNVLNSILDTFNDAMASVSAREQFLKQFDQIVENFRQMKTKHEKKKQDEKSRRDQLNDQYLELVDKQRLYFKTIKDFTDECRKNEILVGKIKGRSKPR